MLAFLCGDLNLLDKYLGASLQVVEFLFFARQLLDTAFHEPALEKPVFGTGGEYEH